MYSGNEREEYAHKHGVGLLLSKDAAKSLIEWEPVSERIITARFTSKGRNITIIHCCAPTNSVLNLKRKRPSTNIYKQSPKNYRRGISKLLWGI